MIIAVSFVTVVAAAILRRVIGRPGGLASGVLMTLPLVLPLIAALVYAHGVLPEVGVLTPARPGTLRSSEEILHLVAVSNGKLITPYALWGSAGPWLMVFGASVSSFMLCRRLVGILMVGRLVRRSRPPDPHEADKLSPVLTTVISGAHLKRPPQLLILPEGMCGAFAVGGRRPRVLLSADLLWSLEDEELAAIVAHEVAHIEARDVQVVAAAGLLRDVVAWNPFAHLAYRRLARDRELEADRRAAAITGNPLAVASGLVKVWDVIRDGGHKHRFALAFLKHRWGLGGRVSRMLALADGPPVMDAAPRAPYLLAATLVAVVGLQAGARIAGGDTGAFAIVWGTPSAESTEVWVAPRPAKEPTARQLARREVASGHRKLLAASTMHENDFPHWIKAMTWWTKHHRGSPASWSGRQEWRAIAMLPEKLGIGIYRIEAGLPVEFPGTAR